MQKYKVTSKKDTVKDKVKYMATAILGEEKPIGNMELAKELSAGTSLNITDVLAIIEQLPEVMSKHLSAGKKVHVKGLGSFHTSIISDLMDTPEEVTPGTVKFSKVAFRAENSLRNTISKGMKAQRIDD